MANMQDFINAMEKRKEYDFICSDGHKYTKWQLIDIIKELVYAIQCQEDRGILGEVDKIRENAMECLQETADEEEREEMYYACYD